ncbi:MAG: SusF/SusE family outer membrane protein [Paludibacteraceae bacterium]|nr:SusF/SusE family outer membrane protein [Paludibacteraceae bacterium]
MALALGFTFATAETTTLYCKVAQSWWKADNAAVAAFAWKDGGTNNHDWPGVRMTAVQGEKDLWSIDVDPATHPKIIFVRVNSTGDLADWGAQTQDLTIPTNGNDLYTITSENAQWSGQGNKVAGEWSKFVPSAQPVEDEYTVLGDPLLFDGHNWDLNNAATLMAKQEDGSYKCTIDEVTLVGDKNYQWKVVTNHAWGSGEYPAQGDYTLKVNKDGKYKVVFTIVVGTGAEAEATLLEEVVIETEYTVVGDSVLIGKKWDINNDNMLMAKQQDGSYTCSIANVTLAPGDYKWKVVANHSWDGEQYPAQGDYILKIEKNGKYKVDFTLVPGETGASAKATLLEEIIVPVINYYLIGSFNDWKLETCEPMEGDSIVYEFAAGKTEFKVLPQKTKWDNALGFAKVNAECSSEGLSGSDGDNVIFTLKEKGNVKIKVVEGKLCVTGAFEVPEPQPVINYYLVGSMNNWSVENAIPLAGDSLVANVEAGKYECKIIPKDLAQDWSNALGYAAVNAECSSEGINEGENGNIVVELKEKGDIKIKVVEGKLCITGPFYVPAAPTLTNGFYLIGQKGWDVAALSAELLFAVNPDNQNEYQLNVTLAKDEGIKVVKVENDVIKAWYPDGEGNEYKVDANHVGAKTIYFQETYKEDWAAFGGYIYIEANPADGISNMTNGMNAQKFIENGQLFIRVNGTIYSVVGHAK